MNYKKLIKLIEEGENLRVEFKQKFSEYDKYYSDDATSKSPEEQLKAVITNFCIMLYKDDEFTSDITAIFVAEMTKPSLLSRNWLINITA